MTTSSTNRQSTETDYPTDRSLVAPINMALAEMRDAGKPLAEATKKIEQAITYAHTSGFLEPDDLAYLKEAKDHIDQIHKSYANVMERLMFIGHVAYSMRSAKYEGVSGEER